MPISLYDAAVPQFVRAMTQLHAILSKGESSGIDLDSLYRETPASGMLPLSGQVQHAAGACYRTVVKLSSNRPPPWPDEIKDTAWQDLMQRVQWTLYFLQAVGADSFSEAESRQVQVRSGAIELQYSAERYLMQVALPNVYFHIAMVYALLRRRGVALEKSDYLGGV